MAFAFLSVFFTLKEQYDVAIASSGPITIGIPGLVARYLKRKPLVFEVRDLWPEGAIQLGKLNNKLLQKLAYGFEHRCYEASQAIIACSEGMAADIRKRFGYQNAWIPESLLGLHPFYLEARKIKTAEGNGRDLPDVIDQAGKQILLNYAFQ